MHVGELPGDSGKVKERWMCPMENCQAIVQRLDDHLQGSHGLKRQSEEMKATEFYQLSYFLRSSTS